MPVGPPPVTARRCALRGQGSAGTGLFGDWGRGSRGSVLWDGALPGTSSWEHSPLGSSPASENVSLAHFLSWLHQEATVLDVDVIPEAGAADVRVVISSSAYSKFRKLFPESASQ